jgi:hypothetical protein
MELRLYIRPRFPLLFLRVVGPYMANVLQREA